MRSSPHHAIPLLLQQSSQFSNEDLDEPGSSLAPAQVSFSYPLQAHAVPQAQLVSPPRPNLDEEDLEDLPPSGFEAHDEDRSSLMRSPRGLRSTPGSSYAHAHGPHGALQMHMQSTAHKATAAITTLEEEKASMVKSRLKACGLSEESIDQMRPTISREQIGEWKETHWCCNGRELFIHNAVALWCLNVQPPYGVITTAWECKL
jgi:hypothetical protein